MNIALDSHWQLRLGGLPASVPEELDGDGHRRSYDRYWTATRHLTERGSQISEALHRAIGHRLADGRDPAAFVALRRALFKVDAEAVARRLTQLTDVERTDFFEELGEHASAVSDWLAHEQRHAETFHDTLGDQRSRLRELAHRGGFLRGLALSSPDLISEIDRYGRALDEKGRVDKRGKRVERSMMSYLLRASAKTTPFSWLGPVSFPQSDSDHRPLDERTTARSRWSVYPLAHVLSVLPERPELVAGFEVRASPYLRAQDDTVLADRATWSFGEVDSRDDYAACVESQVQLNAEGVIALIDELLDRHDGITTWARLADDLAAETGLAPERAGELVQSMLRLGVIVAPALAIDSVDDAGFDRTLHQLADGGESAVELADTLRRYRDTAQHLSSLDDPVQRADMVRRLRDTVAGIYQQVGVVADPPRSVVYEDVIFHDDGAAAASRIELEPESVEALVRLVDLLDTSHIKRDLLAGYYRRTVSAGERVDDVAEFLRGFDTDLLNSFEGYPVDDIADADLESDPWLRWGGAWQREKTRRMLAGELERLQIPVPLHDLDVGDAFNAAAVDLTEHVRELSAAVPALSTPYRHVNLLLQRDATTGTVVMNDCFGGVGFPISRFSHALDERAGHLAADVEQVAAAAGVRLVEISGGTVFSNLNLHDEVLSTRLQVPGDPVRVEQPRVLLDDLEVRWSERDDRAVLAERDTGTIVHPEYAGYLVPMATPRLHQNLALFTPSANLSVKPADLLRAVPEPGHAVIRPRMTVGSVVVVRAAVLIRADALPAGDPLEREGSIAWQRFWARHGLPQRVYLRVLSSESSRRPKPFLFDITLMVCVSNLHSQIRGKVAETTVEITEVLPDPGDAPEASDGTTRVTEAMVGISLVANAAKEQ